MSAILITGGTGFIGSHTSLVLLKKGYYLYIIDSLENSSIDTLKRIKQVDQKYKNKFEFFRGDLRNKELLRKIFIKARESGKIISGIIHFAGLKAVSDSIENPIKYWSNNFLGTLNLVEIMSEFNCKNIIFSSSATVYGCSNFSLLREDSNINPINPYGKTKQAIENLLTDVFKSEPQEWGVINLRYFNPIGAHESGLIGEDPIGKPNNIFPILNQVASNELEKIKIFGDDWGTPDGTCIRDYIHVMDLAEGHVSALEFLLNNKPQCINLNIGTGKGTSVLELVNIFAKVNNVEIQYKFTSRREGDFAVVIADNTKAKELLNWSPSRSLEVMCRDGWKWHRKRQN